MTRPTLRAAARVPAMSASERAARAPGGERAHDPVGRAGRLDAIVLADAARALEPGRPLVHVALDDQRLASLAEALAFFAPDLGAHHLPGLGLPAL